MLLEVHQQPDGSVHVPAALRPYLGGREVLGAGRVSGARRVVATDLDGTLVRTDGTVSRRTCEAMRGGRGGRRVLVLVTGRPPRWMAPVAEATGHRGLAVCANGALLYDLHTETVVDATR